MKTILKYFLTGMLLGLPMWMIAQVNPDMEIEMELCESVVAKRPLNPKKDFDQGERAYLWLDFKNNYEGDYVLVEWYQEDTLRHTQHLYLPVVNMHTYCYKTVSEAGKWKAEVKDRKGNALKDVKFEVAKLSHFDLFQNN